MPLACSGKAATVHHLIIGIASADPTLSMLKFSGDQ
jgi:hypothetical protein